MSDKLCLTRDEIKALTRRTTKACQLRFLRQHGIRHYIDGHGWPVVLRAAVGEEVRAEAPKAAPWRSNKTLPSLGD